MSSGRWLTHSPQETVALGFELGKTLRRGDVVALRGDLGAGKTQYVKGIAQAFGARPHVSSPTFVIMNRYDGRDAEGHEIFLYHVDLYRIDGIEAILDLGLEEIMESDGITVIEWADHMGSLLPRRRIDVSLTIGLGESDRVIEVTADNSDVTTSGRAGGTTGAPPS